MSQDAPPPDPVARQYEAYPYPERDPAEEARRLVIGSPSHPVEIDHFLFEGARDWSRPFRALIAGGGTGDALIMLAQLLAARGVPAEIHYLDMSRASRRIAEARAAARGLTSIRFHTRDLLEAPDLAADVGRFDYIDCCGVLHHLPDPAAGFRALADATAPDGGLGLMVYAPYGRDGVYALQDALAPLIEGLAPEAQVALAKEALARLPQCHPFARNPLLGDHQRDDAGLYDLLLHARDAPFTADRLLETAERAGLSLAGWLEPARYRPSTYLPKGAARDRAEALPPAAQAAFAERFAGNLKAHIAYLAPHARGPAGATVARPTRAELRPRLHRVEPAALAATLRKNGALRFSIDGLTIERRVDRSLASIVARIDGRTSLTQLAAASGLDWMRFSRRFAQLYEPLDGYNILRFSTFSD